jgi:hypothetical protein
MNESNDMNERDTRERAVATREDRTAREERLLDAALAANLPAPPLPVHFRSRLMASVRASALEDQAAMRQALASEAQRKLNELRAEFIEVRRRTLVAYIGLAFIAGVIMAIVLPSILQSFGSLGVYVVPAVAGMAGLAVGLNWLRRTGWLD